MPISAAPDLAKLTFLVGDGDICFSGSTNDDTGVFDTFLITVVEPGATGDPEASGRTDGLVDHEQPADVALRFTSRRSLEAFVLAAAELLGGARSDVEAGDSLEVAD